MQCCKILIYILLLKKLITFIKSLFFDIIVFECLDMIIYKKL